MFWRCCRATRYRHWKSNPVINAMNWTTSTVIKILILNLGIYNTEVSRGNTGHLAGMTQASKYSRHTSGGRLRRHLVLHSLLSWQSHDLQFESCCRRQSISHQRRPYMCETNKTVTRRKQKRRNSVVVYFSVLKMVRRTSHEKVLGNVDTS